MHCLTATAITSSLF